MKDFFKNKMKKLFGVLFFALMPISLSAIYDSSEFGMPIDSKAPRQFERTINEEFFHSIFLGTHSDVINALKNGADINYHDDRGKTALHESVLRMLDNSRVKIMHSLINRGIKLDAEDSDGKTALHWAVIMSFTADRNHKLEVINLLLKSGASPNVQDNKGDTPLHRAIDKYWPNNQIEIIDSLLQAGACLTIKNKKTGNTPLHSAVDKGFLDIVKVFLKKRAGKSTEDGLAILAEDSGVNALDNEGWSPLLTAAYRKNAEMVKTLIDAGADLELRTPQGGTALRIAVEQDHKGIVEILVKAGADINTRTDAGLTPLQFAYSTDKSEMAAFLIKLGATRDWRYWLATIHNVMPSNPKTYFAAIGGTALALLVLKLYWDYKQYKFLLAQQQFQRQHDRGLLKPHYNVLLDFQRQMPHI